MSDMYMGYPLRTNTFVITVLLMVSGLISSFVSGGVQDSEPKESDQLDALMEWVCSVRPQQEREVRVSSLLGNTESMGKTLREQDKPYMEYIKTIFTADSAATFLEGDVLTHTPSNSDLLCTVYYEYVRMSPGNIIQGTTPGMSAVLIRQDIRSQTEILKKMAQKPNYMGSRAAYILAKRKGYELSGFNPGLDLINSEDAGIIKKKRRELSGLFEDVPSYGAQYASLYFRLLLVSDEERIAESEKQMKRYAEYHALESETESDFTLTIYTRLAEPEIREESRTEESKKESIRTRRLKAMRALAG
nr:hypothetical protein [Endozoicomonas sp.]